MKPNVLVICSDQHRADHMECSGHPVIQTPAMDRLAREGVQFDQAYCNSPLCVPSRASICTGRYPHNHGMIANRGYILDGENTFYQGMRDAGYHTAVIGKLHLGCRARKDLRDEEHVAYVNRLGFVETHETGGKGFVSGGWGNDPYSDYLRGKGTHDLLAGVDPNLHFGLPVVQPTPLPTEDYQDSYIGAQCVKWLKSYSRKEPFFLWAGFVGPHPPWDAPAEYEGMYPLESVVAPLDDPLTNKPEIQVRDRLDVDERQIRCLRASYYGMVTLIDEWIGKMLSALESRDMLEETIVIYTSDHGELLGDRGLLGKRRFYEQSVRVPMIVRWPKGYLKGVRSAALVELIDLMPTCIEAAGGAIPRSCLGESFSGVLTGASNAHRDLILSELSERAPEKMIRTDRYKYVYSPGEAMQELYDLENDPDEKVNLAGRKAGARIEAFMKDALLERMVQTEAPINAWGRIWPEFPDEYSGAVG